MKKVPCISVLMPAYNSEHYIAEAIESVLNQTFKDFEFIIINDGSTDNTLNIINKYAKQDDRIIVIDKPNEGYGKSMNRGLDIAKGEYVGIVESDDWIEKDMFEKLYNTAKKNKADIVKADFVFFDNDTKQETPCWSIGILKELQETIFCPIEQNPEILWSGHPSIWTCLYSNKMIKDNHIRFAEIPGAAFQDMGFKLKTLIVSKRFYYLPDTVLHYRKHANNSDKNNSKVFAVCDVHDDVDKWLLKNRPDLKGAQKIINQCRFANYIWNICRLSGDAKRDFRKRFASDFYDKYKSKELERCYFDDKTWIKLLCLIYPKKIFLNSLRVLLAIISPIYKTRIRNGQKVHYLFNTIVLRKRKIPAFSSK